MNLNSCRKTYGTLPLTPARTHAMQLEWSFVEPAAPGARFLNFPCIDAEPAPRTRRTTPQHKRRLAA